VRSGRSEKKEGATTPETTEAKERPRLKRLRDVWFCCRSSLEIRYACLGRPPTDVPIQVHFQGRSLCCRFRRVFTPVPKSAVTGRAGGGEG
jgi:hypothetical protein